MAGNFWQKHGVAGLCFRKKACLVGRVKAFLLVLTAFFVPWSHAVELVLPTENTAIFRGGGPAFYMYVERNFEGQKSQPWEGGKYGFVRDPVRTPEGLVFKRLHEGLDIKPVRRDARGVPLDPVKAVARGEVVHVSDKSSASNYGKFIVIQHLWDGCLYYSLYAHLNHISVTPGESVAAGQTIGVLGFTGRGINIIRAHLHFEINLLLSNRFEEWHVRNFQGSPNVHGLFNGLNLSGFDPAAFLLQNKKDPSLSIPAFLARQEVFYRIQVPAPGPVDLVGRYPWMRDNYRAGQAAEISFLRSGLPVKVKGLNEAVSAPRVSWVKPVRAPLRYYTKNYINDTPSGPQIAESGLRFLELLGVQ